MNGGALPERAETLARALHAGQLDRTGAPYIEHPAAVAGLLAAQSDELVAAAWLHDVLEHTSATAGDLRAAGIPPEVVRLVEVLTRAPDEDYLDFIGRVAADPAAARVKLADTLHNLDPLRDAGFSPERRVRYHTALVELCRAVMADAATPGPDGRPAPPEPLP